VCGSNLAGLTLLYIVLPCVADVSIVNCAVCQQFNKRTLLLLLHKHRCFVKRSARYRLVAVLMHLAIIRDDMAVFRHVGPDEQNARPPVKPSVIWVQKVR